MHAVTITPASVAARLENYYEAISEPFGRKVECSERSRRMIGSVVWHRVDADPMKHNLQTQRDVYHVTTAVQARLNKEARPFDIEIVLYIGPESGELTDKALIL